MCNLLFWASILSLIVHLIGAYYMGTTPEWWGMSSMASLGALFVAAMWKVEKVSDETLNLEDVDE